MTTATPQQSSKPKLKARVAVNSANTLIVRDVPNIIVLVGGTVDPGNTSPTARSASYHNPKVPLKDSDANHYWEENTRFLEDLEALRKEYTNLHVFTAHGWSGDNNPTNRTITGTYLADRLCGGNRETPYYGAFLKRAVSFHLIGHSHGGNVINAFTERAATSKAWPKQWKIRSITYLSTPFFTRLHQVNTGAFHDDCRIINVFCKYDLTQRVIADFSLMPLTEVIGMGEDPKKPDPTRVPPKMLMESVAAIRFDFGKLKEAVLSTRLVDKDEDVFGWDIRLLMDKTKAERVYDEALTALAQLGEVFVQVKTLLHQLNVKRKLHVPVELKGKMTAEHQLLSDALLKRFLAEIQLVESGIVPTQKALKARRKAGEYPVTGLYDDLQIAAFLKPLVRLVGVDRKTLDGPLWSLIGALLEEQMHEFDNTSNSPAAQLAKTKFASRIVHVDVTREDEYHQKHKEKEYDRFLAMLEAIEKRFAATRSPRDLRDLLFTLLAQIEPLRQLVKKWGKAADWAEDLARLAGKVKSPGLKLTIDLVKSLESYFVIFSERDTGGLQVDVPKREPPYGSLDYLMRVSHSVSRQDLYDDPKNDVKTPLKAQFDTRKRRGG
ncbi:hypothetical protein ACN6A1_32645 [Myxococcus virescens]|uniref:hypothetical protein n=1 Tax=Myxococcus virescens TaxID=83456 RepID=UPI003DA5E4B9